MGARVRQGEAPRPTQRPGVEEMVTHLEGQGETGTTEGKRGTARHREKQRQELGENRQAAYEIDRARHGDRARERDRQGNENGENETEVLPAKAPES